MGNWEFWPTSFTHDSNLGQNDSYLDTPGSQRQSSSEKLKKDERMAAKLSHLPKPKNEFDLILPDEGEGEESSMTSEVCAFRVSSGSRRFVQDWVEDAAEVKERRAKLEQRRQQKERLLRTQAFQRELPLPTKLNDQYIRRPAASNDLVNVSLIIYRLYMFKNTYADQLSEGIVNNPVSWFIIIALGQMRWHSISPFLSLIFYDAAEFGNGENCAPSRVFVTS